MTCLISSSCYRSIRLLFIKHIVYVYIPDRIVYVLCLEKCHVSSVSHALTCLSSTQALTCLSSTQALTCLSSAQALTCLSSTQALTCLSI